MATITSTTTGNFATGATWVGGVAPISTDDFVIANTHTVTVAATDTVAGGNVNAGGVLVVNDTVVLTLDGSVTVGGTVTQNAGSTVTFNGNYDMTFTGDTGVWDVNGASGNRATLQAAATFGFSIQDAANNSLATFTPTYCDITRWGRANAAADHAMDIRSNAKASVIELTNCKIDTYWRRRFGAGWNPSVTATFKHTNCSHFNPQYVDLFDYSCNTNFNANTRGFWDCTFVGDATNRKFSITTTGTSWTNPFIVSGCIGEDVTWTNTSGAPIELDVVTHYSAYTSTANDIYLSTGGDGQWKVYDTIVDATRSNAHIISSSGGSVSGGIIEDTITFGTGAADNHYAFDAGTTYQRNISVGGNGLLTTAVGSGTPLLDRHTHINKAGNFDCMLLQETNNFTANSITLRNSLMVGINDAGEDGVEVLTVGDQDYAYLDYNCFFQIADHYEQCTVANDTLTEGVSTGFGANDITADPQLNNKDATLATWDTSLGGAGTSANAFNEMLKLNGFDKTGAADTFDTNYTKANVLTYLRTAFTPTNVALDGAGLAGVDIGAIAVDASSTITSSGSLQADTATVAGVATNFTTITSSGSLQADTATVSGDVIGDPVTAIVFTTITTAGSVAGSLQADTATVSGVLNNYSTIAISVSGSLQAETAIVSASLINLTVKAKIMISLNKDEYGDIIYFNFNEDVSTATAYDLVLEPRTGTKKTKAISDGVTLGADTIIVDGERLIAQQYIKYTTQDGDIDQSGMWRYRGTATMSATRKLIPDYKRISVLD